MKARLIFGRAWSTSHAIEVAGHRCPIRLSEALLLLVLMGREWASHDDLIEILWPSALHSPMGTKAALGVRICHLRKALQRAGWTIENSHRLGYRLVRANFGDEQQDRRAA